MQILCQLHLFSATCLLNPFAFGSSLDKPGWQAEMRREELEARSRLVGRVVKETIWKGIVQKEEAAVCHKLDRGQCHFAKGERMLCMAGIRSHDASTDTRPKPRLMGAAIRAHMETEMCTRRGSVRSRGLAWRTGHAEGRGRIWGTSAGSLLEPAEVVEASIDHQAS